MNIFKIIWNIKNIRAILEGSYKLLNKCNEPKDFEVLIRDIRLIQKWILKVCMFMGSDPKVLVESIEVACIIDETDKIEMA